MVKIRLSRVGTKNQAKYRIVSTDGRVRRDGKFLEILGSYDPNVEPAKFDIKKERYEYWLSVGAQPSDAVASLVKKLK